VQKTKIISSKPHSLNPKYFENITETTDEIEVFADPLRIIDTGV
jgi:hypothetical protein